MKHDAVNNPIHYGGLDNPYESIKIIEALEFDFYIGNVFKYISRAGKKDDLLQDLKKARWYLDRKILKLEEQQQLSKPKPRHKPKQNVKAKKTT